jgi:hypothetical protein
MIRSERKKRSLLAVDVVVAAMVIFAGIPFYYALEWRIAGIPLLNVFYLATMLAVAVSYFRYTPADNRLLMLYGIGGIWLCAISMIHVWQPTFEGRAAFQDLSTYLGLMAGVAVAQLKGQSGLYRVLPRWYAANCLILGVSLLGLLTGYIPSKLETRLLDGSLYSSVLFVQVTFPAVWSTSGSVKWRQKALALSGIAMAAVFTLVSATRSVLIALLASLVLTALVQVKRKRSSAIWGGAFLLVLLFFAITGNQSGFDLFRNTQLNERLSSTDYTHESRFEELTGMLGQMDAADWVVGVGLGSSFESPNDREDMPGFAIVPHIGITTLLYKGGVIVFVALILLPCLIACFRLLTSKSSSQDPFLAGVAVYFVEASLSGGWTFLALFMLGMFLHLGLQRDLAEQANRAPGVRLSRSGRFALES